MKPLNRADRDRLFGKFEYKLAPVPGNPEKIIVTDNWATLNLRTVQLPMDIAALPGADVAVLHRLAVEPFQDLLEAWREAGVIGDIKTWNGSYAARLVRGTTQGTLSSHAWGTAVDINAPWNGLGVDGPKAGQPGSVMRLVPIAEKFGWYWGGHFTRKDMMHFELAQL